MPPSTRRRSRILARLFRSYQLVIMMTSVILMAVLAVHLGCQHDAPKAVKQPLETAVPRVRVRILQETTAARLTPMPGLKQATARVAGGRPFGLPFVGKAPLTLAATTDGWEINGERVGSGELTLDVEPPGTVGVEGRAYRGNFHCVATKVGAFDLVNHLSVDEYLQGVLSAELYPDFQIEAYKAQAVIARTYAVYVSRKTPSTKHWDLNSDTRSQAYGGIRTETAKSIEAANSTAGLLVAYGPPGNVKIFKAYYSSCCGGATQTAQDVFGEAPSEPFTAKSVGRRCDIGVGRYHSQFDWEPVVVKKDELARRFKTWGKKVGHPIRAIETVKKIEISKKSVVGRPIAFTIEDTKGTQFTLTGEQLRLAVNTDSSEQTRLLSSFVTPVSEGATIRFQNGHGYGHGVGMCQWCAEAQARQGLSFEKIVLDAYKGAVVVKGY